MSVNSASESEEESMFLERHSIDSNSSCECLNLSQKVCSGDLPDFEKIDLTLEIHSAESNNNSSNACLDLSLVEHTDGPYDSKKEDESLERLSAVLDVYLEGYTSSIESTTEDSLDDISAADNENEKTVIFKLYKILSMKLLQTFSIDYWSVVTSLNHLMSNYRQVRDGNLPTQIDYTNKSHCIGYLHRYAACHAALVFDAVSEILDSSSSEILSSKLNKKRLNVMFLGGGPGNDFVGFLTALYGHHHDLFDLDVTVVDKMSGWEDVFNETIESLRQGAGGKAGSVFDEVNIMTTFISADLKDSEEWDENMQTKLKTTDIVFIVKALSHIPNRDKLQVLQNVVTIMQVGSLLIYIDYPYPSEVFASLNYYLKNVYQSWKTRYRLGHKESGFGYANIDTCQAEARAFTRW